MVTLSDVVAGIGLAVVGGVALAGHSASASASGAESALPQGFAFLGAVGVLLAVVVAALLVVHMR